jgi:hypothetical protein
MVGDEVILSQWLPTDGTSAMFAHPINDSLSFKVEASLGHERSDHDSFGERACELGRKSNLLGSRESHDDKEMEEDEDKNVCGLWLI